MRLSKELIEQALVEYQQRPVHFKVFAKKIGSSSYHAAEILRGTKRLDVQRPPGFKFMDVPPESNGRRKLTDDQVAEALRLYEENQWEAPQFAKHLGMNSDDALLILRFETYKHVPRPQGLKVRLNGHFRKKKIADGLALALENDWSVKQLAAYVGFSYNAARGLLSGKTHSDIPTPVVSKRRA